MRTSRLRFKYALRLCKRNELSTRANAHAKSLLDKDIGVILEGHSKSKQL